MSANWDSTLTPQEVQAYGQFFNAANGGKSAVVNGQEAVTFFARSGIPNEILSDIWETADRDNLGYLTPETFSIALKLIASAQHGVDVSEPILSTVVPLPQFEGFNPNATSPPENPTNEIITPSEREKYLGIFRAHQPVQGVLDAKKVKNIFNKSKLPNEYLTQIWNLADLRKAGNLNQTEFIIAMHYIAKLMDRSITALPVQLPAKIYGSAAGSIQSSPVLRRTSMSPAALMQQRQFTGGIISTIAPLPRPQQHRTESIESLGSKAFSSKDNSIPTSVPQQPTAMWDVTPQQKMQSDILFNQIDTKRTGVIQGNEAVEFFKKSRLPDTDLARVWDLADLEQDGQLTTDEFAVAMYLIQSRIAGKPLPSILPKSLIPPSKANTATINSPQQQMYQSPPSMITSPPQQQQQQPEEQPPVPQEDLLGDFGNNEELTSETNAVNQLQYKISNVKSTTIQVKSQKEGLFHSLEQTQQQKQNLEAQSAQLMNSQRAQLERLAELQQLIKTEEPGWIQVQQEHDAAQKELEEVQTEVMSMKQTLEQGRTDSEEFRRRVHDVQEETASLINQLEKLRIYVNKKGGATATATTPAVAETHVSFNKGDQQKLTFDDIFSPQPLSAASVTSPITTTVTQNVDDDFDAIFAPQPATATTTNTAAIAEKRQPPPPPPPSRRTTIRRQEPQQAAKKSRAPPPPPPPSATAATATVSVIQESDEYESDSTASSGTESSEDGKTQNPTKAETTSPQATTSSPPTQESFVNEEKKATRTESKEDSVQDTGCPVVKHYTKASPAENMAAEPSLVVEEQAQPLDESVEPDFKEVQSKKEKENKTRSLNKPEESEENDVVVETEGHDGEEKQRVAQPISDEPGIKTVFEDAVEKKSTAEEDGKETSTPYVLDDSENTMKTVKPLTEPKVVDEPETQELAVGPPKEEDRVTSEILSDKITPDFKESIPAVLSTSQEDNAFEAEPKESVDIKEEPSETPEESKDEYFTPPQNENSGEEITLVENPEKDIKVEKSLMSTQNKAYDISGISSETSSSNDNNIDNVSTKESEQQQERPESLEKIASLEADLGASTESFVSISELPQEEEQKDDDDDIPLAKLKNNVFEQASRQDEKDNDEVSSTFISAAAAVAGATVAVASAPIGESSTMSNENQDSMGSSISIIKQGDKLTDEVTSDAEKEEKMDKDAPQEIKPSEQEQNTIKNKRGQDTEESSVEDEYLSVPDDDDNNEDIVDSNGHHDVITSRNASMQDNKENKSIEEQTEPSVKQSEEQKKEDEKKSSQEDEKRAETTTSLTSTTKEEGKTGATDNACNTSDDDSIASDKDRLKGVNTTHNGDETPKDITNSESSIANEPQEYLEEESSSNSKNINKNNNKEVGQGLLAYNAITKKDDIEEKEEQSTRHEDFDALFMERPNNKERTSSDGGGESFEIISSATSPTENQQAAPSTDEFDAAFASELQNAKVIDESSFFNQEDFDAAFADELTNAKVVQNSDIDNDKNNNGNSSRNYTSSNKKQGDKLSWASNFGGFNFDDDFDGKEQDEEWDSIFGGNEDKAGGTEHVGFQDAFSATNFNNNQTKDDDTKTNNNNINPFDTIPGTETVVADPSPLPPPEATSTSSASATKNNNYSNKESSQEDKGIISTGNSNLDQLIIMGFNRDLAKEALDRYDQDLEKATNFLLDLAAK